MPKASCYLVLVSAAIVLAACSSESEPQRSVSDEPAPSVIGDPLHRAVERAESVQATLDEHAAQLRRQVEESEGN